jgi:hypothetical protein
MRFLIAVACLTVAWRYASHAGLRRYFAVNLACTAVWELMLMRWSYDSTVYAVAWIMGIGAIYVFELALMRDTIRTIRPTVLPYLSGSLAFALLMLVITHPKGLLEWVQAANGASDLFCAIPTLLGAAWLSGIPRKIGFSLGALWLTQAAYELGFGLHLTSPAWITVNNWLPTLIVAVGCLWIAHIGHREESGADSFAD